MTQPMPQSGKMNKTKKYAVCPGYVSSKSDGQVHYVTGRQLIELYRVDPNECLVIQCEGDKAKLFDPESSGIVILTPRHDGNYEL